MVVRPSFRSGSSRTIVRAVGEISRASFVFSVKLVKATIAWRRPVRPGLLVTHQPRWRVIHLRHAERSFFVPWRSMARPDRIVHIKLFSRSGIGVCIVVIKIFTLSHTIICWMGAVAPLGNAVATVGCSSICIMGLWPTRVARIVGVMNSTMTPSISSGVRNQILTRIPRRWDGRMMTTRSGHRRRPAMGRRRRHRQSHGGVILGWFFQCVAPGPRSNVVLGSPFGRLARISVCLRGDGLSFESAARETSG